MIFRIKYSGLKEHTKQNIDLKPFVFMLIRVRVVILGLFIFDNFSNNFISGIKKSCNFSCESINRKQKR